MIERLMELDGLLYDLVRGATRRLPRNPISLEVLIRLLELRKAIFGAALVAEGDRARIHRLLRLAIEWVELVEKVLNDAWLDAKEAIGKALPDIKAELQSLLSETAPSASGDTTGDSQERDNTTLSVVTDDA
ncbi:hypothetical protein [Nannocystis pusilla]|uniref:hypothetical protein n=1 Tax=Nannocystis pusilla TaxID=889268 RepID=UPI003B76E6F0